MRKLLVLFCTFFVFTSAQAATDTVKVRDITEPPRVEKMHEQTYQTKFFTVSSSVSGALSAETTHISFRMPYKFKILGLRASVQNAPTADMILDINESGTTILSTKLYIQSGSTTSVDAHLSTSPSGSEYVISDDTIADDAIVTVDIDSTTGGKDLKITFYGEIQSIPASDEY